MPLVKSPILTAAKLAANRANAQKSTGPRTPQGKARVALNALKHGRYALQLREKIIRTGDQGADRHYRWLRSEIAQTFQPQDPSGHRQVEQLANQLWCLAKVRKGTKPGCGVPSGGKGTRENVLSPRKTQRYRVVDRYRRVGVVFWVQRRRYWLRNRLRELPGWWSAETPGIWEPLKAIAKESDGVEEGWRRRRFCLPTLGPWARAELEAEERRLRARSRAGKGKSGG